MGRNMRTAFETMPARFINGKRIETHFSKCQARKEEISAQVFFNQALMRGLDVQEAKEETEIAYPSIQVNVIELDSCASRPGPRQAIYRCSSTNWPRRAT